MYARYDPGVSELTKLLDAAEALSTHLEAALSTSFGVGSMDAALVFGAA